MVKLETAPVEFLLHALEESVKLQSHYAGLLNMHDGGERTQFAGVESWLTRLAACKAPNELAAKLVEALGETLQPFVGLTATECKAARLAAAFMLDHELDPPLPGDLEAALHGVIEKIDDVIEPECCGECEGCREARENMQ